MKVVKKLEDPEVTRATLTSMAEAAPLLAALDVIDAEWRKEGGPLEGTLKNLRYRLRSKKF
jgi:hypothetical protein